MLTLCLKLLDLQCFPILAHLATLPYVSQLELTGWCRLASVKILLGLSWSRMYGSVSTVSIVSAWVIK